MKKALTQRAFFVDQQCVSAWISHVSKKKKCKGYGHFKFFFLIRVDENNRVFCTIEMSQLLQSPLSNDIETDLKISPYIYVV